jgi:putative peptidoglycan lipid II flippase
MLYNISIIFGAAVLSRPWGVEGLAVGVVAGAGLHLAVQVPGLVRERMRYSFVFGRADAAVREVLRLMAPRVVGLAAAQLNFVVTIFFASKVGTAEISDLNYAWLLAQLPLAVFGMAISTAVFPRLAGQVAADDRAAMQETLSRALRIIMFFSIPAATGLALLAAPATMLLLQRGEFTATDTAITSASLAWFCLGIVPQAGIEIHSRGFYALGDTLTPVIFAVGAVGLNLGLSGLLFSRFEHEGLAFAVSLAAWFEWLMLYYFYVARTRASAAADLRAIAVFGLCASAMALFLAAGLVRLDASGYFENGVTAVGGGLAGALFYAGAARVTRVPEFEEALDRLRAIAARWRPANGDV